MKAERQRIEAFKLQCWRRFFRVPWTAGRSNLSVLKEINPEYSLEGLMLKLEYFGHLMRGDNSLKKILMLGKIEGRRRRGRQRMRWLDSITDSMDVNLSEKVGIWLWSWSGSATHLPQCSLLTRMHKVSLFSPYNVGLIAYLAWPEKLLMKSWVGKSISAALVPMLSKWELVFLIREKEQDLGAFSILSSFKFCL